MIQRAVVFAGHSNSGKTTLICRLIEHFTAQGIELGAIKHTHHALDGLLPGGDSGRFLGAGARAAILAGTGEAILFTRSEEIPPVRFEWRQPSDLAGRLDFPLLMIEGFKSGGTWPKVLVGQPGAPFPPPDACVIATVGVCLPGMPQFAADDIEGLAGFLDRILRR